MTLPEDIDEDLDDTITEDMDDSLLSDDDLSERRRRRRIRGRGYSTPRSDNSAVTQTQMQAAMARVASDVRKIAASHQELDGKLTRELKRVRSDGSQSNQMAALLPLLFKPKAKTLGEVVAAGELTTAKFMIDSGDSLTLLLPLLMMGGMGGSSGTGSGGSGDNNMMLLAVALMATQKK